MIRLWRQLSATYKILITMLFLIVVIQLSTLFYIWKFETKLLLHKERETLHYQLNINARLLSQHLKSLEKELAFLSTLEVMDDILVNDIDKRINILLEKKAADLAEDIKLLAKNSQGQFLSDISESDEQFLTFDVPIYASFDKHKVIGTLLLLYPLKNLIQLSIENLHQTLWLKPPTEIEGFSTPQLAESIIVSQRLNGILEGWELFLAYEKRYALGVIQEIETILLWGSLFSLFSLLLMSWILSRKQIEILEHTEEVLKLKRIFLSTMSHELRTPLGSILNLTQHLMVNPKMSDSDVEMLRRIENSSEHLLSMINNLLQLSKLESNSMTVTKASVDIVEVIHETIEMVEPLIDEKGLALIQHLPQSSKVIETDLHHFRQVIMNLLSNAIKFTDTGTITLSLTEQNGSCIFSVIDTGIGIAQEKQAALFSEFYQAHMGSQEIKHSTGLGLALSQKVAALIGGRIDISSEGIGKGVHATFTFKKQF